MGHARRADRSMTIAVYRNVTRSVRQARGGGRRGRAARGARSDRREPSRNDHALTKRLAEALALVDVRLINHLVVGDGELVSFVERGWL